MASLDPALARRYRRLKGLSSAPTLEGYRDGLRKVLSALRAQTNARVALCTLPPLGEELDGAVNAHVRAHNDVIREVAADSHASLLDVYAALAEELARRASVRRTPWRKDAWRLVRAMVQRHVLGRSFAAIAASNGHTLSSDGIHLTEEAAELAGAVIAPFLRSAPRSGS
jgi:lysophospholipase L1-like esterase